MERDDHEWLAGTMTGRITLLDAAFASGTMKETEAVPPDLLVLIAQYDAAMTARAAIVAAWRESARAAATFKEPAGSTVPRDRLSRACAERDEARRALEVANVDLADARARVVELEAWKTEALQTVYDAGIREGGLIRQLEGQLETARAARAEIAELEPLAGVAVARALDVDRLTTELAGTRGVLAALCNAMGHWDLDGEAREAFLNARRVLSDQDTER